jgi:uncharacterized protein (TIGR00288 family)
MKSIALLIDADNSPSKFIQKILTELANYGKVNIRRAYGNWASSNMNGWQAIIQDHAIQPIQQYDLTKGKNATDIALTIDAMDILYTKNTDAFCIVTSDCDFTPLATRILSEGKLVIGFGQRKTPSPFVNACSTFLFLDEETKKKSKSSKESEIKGNEKLVKLLRNAVTTTTEENGWSKLSRVGTLISNHVSFDSRNYGYTRLSDLIEATGLFNLKRDDNNHFVVKINGK